VQPFRVAAARAAGMSEAQIRSPGLAAPFHGVRAALGVESDPRALAYAYAVKMRRDAAFSHATAAQLLGAPLPVRFGAAPLHVAVPSETSPPRGRGVIGHRLDGADRGFIAVGGLRVLPPAVAWLTLGGMLDVPDLVAVADALVTPARARAPWCSVDDLRAAFRAFPRLRGRGAVRVALTLVRSGSASRPESLLRVLLHVAGFPEPALNFPVPGLPYRVDLAWPEWGFGIEYDGRYHARPSQARADSVRQETIHDRDWLLMRVIGDDLFDSPRELVERARRRVAARGHVVPRRDIAGMMLPRR